MKKYHHEQALIISLAFSLCKTFVFLNFFDKGTSSKSTFWCTSLTTNTNYNDIDLKPF